MQKITRVVVVLKRDRGLTVGLNARGNRVGESHHLAKLSDHEVALILELHDRYHLGYKRLGQKFDCSPKTIESICTGRRRAQLPVRTKRMPHARPLADCAAVRLPGAPRGIRWEDEEA